MAKKKKAETETADEPKGVKSHSWMLAQLKAAQEADHDNRQAAREAAIFLHKRGGQWEDIAIARNPNEPKYSFDLTSPVVEQSQRTMNQLDYGIKVAPASGDASKETAETFNGLVRNIENISNAKRIYSRAGRSVIIKGIDGWGVKNDYIDGDSFDQDLIIESIPNWIDSVWLGPHTEQDGSDASIAWKLVGLTKEEFEAKYPDRSTSASVSSDTTSHTYFNRTDLVMIGQFYYLEESERTLVMMSNGRVFDADSEEYKTLLDEMTAAGVTEMRTRKRIKRCVYIRKFDASGWIDEPKKTVFENWIPLVPCYANFDIIDEGKLIYYGAVEKVMDPQRVFNYAATREIKEGVLASRSKYWMSPDQAAGHEAKLATLNTNNDPVQLFNPDDKLPGPPQQIGGAQINPGLARITESMQAIIGSVSGVFSAGMGEAQSFAQSADTIDALQDKTEAGSDKYVEARTVAQLHTAKILIDAIPRVYLPDRQVRILAEDGTHDMVTIGQQAQDTQTGKMVTLNDLSQGQYDVTCVVGPSFQNRQSQTVTALTEVGAVDPSVIQMGGDILLKNISSPGMDQLADRKRAQLFQQGLIPQDQMTDEELQQLQQMQQQPQQPDPNTLLAQAEHEKAMAMQAEAQTKQEQAQAEIQQTFMELQIKSYEAETERRQLDLKWQELGLKAPVYETQALKNIADAHAKRTSTGIEIHGAMHGAHLPQPKPQQQPSP